MGLRYFDASPASRVKSGDYLIERTNSPTDYNLDPFAGQFYYRTPTSPPKEIFSLDKVIGQIDSGSRADVSDGIITYGFYTGKHAVGLNNSPKFGEGKGYTPFSAEQKAAAVASIQMWDDLIPAKFVNNGDIGVRDWAHQNTDIILSNTTTGPAQAWAYYPGYSAQYTRVSSDVWIASPEANWSNNWFQMGGYGNTTLIHELGHAIGLSHPGAYNGAAATTYDGMAEYAQDSMQYTIMSYWSGSSTRALTVNWNVLLNNYAQTPMLHDILTIQSIYGADLTTRVDDTVYGFNSTAGRDVFDFSKNPYPYAAIYDAGGNDTIDLSGFTTSQFLSLKAGTFSSIGAAIPTASVINANTHAFNVEYGTTFGDVTQAYVDSLGGTYMSAAAARIAAYTGVSGINATAHDNFAIAYGVTIENGIGGSARDLIHGNEVANVLEGRGGDDVLRGFEGNDTLIGGDGNDTLDGGSGNDLLLSDAGIESLTGGSGADTFKFTVADLHDLITDFQSDDRIDLSSLGNDLHFIGDGAFTGHAGEVNFIGTTLSADLDGNGVADFAVTMQAGAALHPDQLVLHG
nr:M10 family metallopeptidase C-terminal domain-containing protein [uncultured Sphingomonas sp.]